MQKLKKWYNKMLVEKYDGKNIDLLEMLGEKRPFLFCLPLYSPSLYFEFKSEKVAKAFFDGLKKGLDETEQLAEKIRKEMPKALEQTSTSTDELSKEIQRIFGAERTETDQAFIDDIWGIKKKGENK